MQELLRNLYRINLVNDIKETDSYYIVTLNFMDKHNDCIQLYIEKKTIHGKYYMALEIENEANENDIIKNLMASNGIMRTPEGIYFCLLDPATEIMWQIAAMISLVIYSDVLAEV